MFSGCLKVLRQPAKKSAMIPESAGGRQRGEACRFAAFSGCFAGRCGEFEYNARRFAARLGNERNWDGRIGLAAEMGNR